MSEWEHFQSTVKQVHTALWSQCPNKDAFGDSLKRPGRKRMYQSRHHLSQMHTTNYICPLYGKRRLTAKKFWANMGVAAPRPPFEFATVSRMQSSGVGVSKEAASLYPDSAWWTFDVDTRHNWTIPYKVKATWPWYLLLLAPPLQTNSCLLLTLGSCHSASNNHLQRNPAGCQLMSSWFLTNSHKMSPNTIPLQ